MTPPQENWRPGAVRYKDNDGIWTVAEPHDSLYSLALFLATEWWCSKSKTWARLFDGEDNEA